MVVIDIILMYIDPFYLIVKLRKYPKIYFLPYLLCQIYDQLHQTHGRFHALQGSIALECLRYMALCH